MIIIPAIDIMDGKCVRLTKGEFSTKKVYSSDPLEMARNFERQGAKMLHVIDLDAAKTGIPANQKLILEIARAISIPVETGGGIRELKTARAYLNYGIQRIVVGTKAITEPSFLTALINEFGAGRIVVAVETKQGKIAIKGWQNTIEKNYLDLAKELKALGVSEILFTDVEKDGTLTQPNFSALENLIKMGFNIIASGGISDLAAIKKLKILGAFAAILGKSLYENRIALKDALDIIKPASNLTKRIIPCLDVRDGKVVKGFKFRDHVVMGEIVDLARRYRDEQADELVFYDITASPEGRTVSRDWVEKVARVIDIPFCVAGGIRSVEDAKKVLRSGADKISINSPALENPGLIDELAAEFGSQCVVIGVDSFEDNGDYFVKQYTGDPTKTRATKWRTFDWLKEVQTRGAGEVVLNCMKQDGVKRGYDINQLKAARKLLTIPLVASGGAGSMENFRDVFQKTDVDAALAASVFHSGAIPIPDLKTYLKTEGIPIRA